MSSYFILAFFFYSVLIQLSSQKAVGASDPTDGFISLPLNSSNFGIQRPYNVPVRHRYSFIHGVHRLWVFSTDKPHSLTSKTSARTEIRIRVNNPNNIFVFSIALYCFLFLQLFRKTWLWDMGVLRPFFLYMKTIVLWFVNWLLIWWWGFIVVSSKRGMLFFCVLFNDHPIGWHLFFFARALLDDT